MMQAQQQARRHKVKRFIVHQMECILENTLFGIWDTIQKKVEKSFYFVLDI